MAHSAQSHPPLHIPTQHLSTQDESEPTDPGDTAHDLSTAHAAQLLSHTLSQVIGTNRDFKIDLSKKDPAIFIARTSMKGVDLVAHIVHAQSVLEQCVENATRRDPTTQQDWQSVYRFLNSHLAEDLRGEMKDILSRGTVMGYDAYWNELLHLLLPRSTSTELVDTFLADYAVWKEPQGLSRWLKVTRQLVSFICERKGMHGAELAKHAQELMLQQVLRTFNKVPDETKRMQFIEQYDSVHKELHSQGILLTAQHYQAACDKLIDPIRNRMQNNFSSAALFGVPTTSRAPHHKPMQQHAVPEYAMHARQISQQQEVPYSTVVAAGGEGLHVQQIQHAKPYGSAAAKTNMATTVPSNFSIVGPAGNLRKFGPNHLTKKINGKQVRLVDPAPVASLHGQPVEYYGDWLEMQGLCTYCQQPGHVRIDCDARKQAASRYEQWVSAQRGGNAGATSSTSMHAQSGNERRPT